MNTQDSLGRSWERVVECQARAPELRLYVEEWVLMTLKSKPCRTLFNPAIIVYTCVPLLWKPHFKISHTS